jgi:hypothetical protein
LFAARVGLLSYFEIACASVPTSLAIRRLCRQRAVPILRKRVLSASSASANPVTTKTTPPRSNILNTRISKISGGGVAGGRGGSVGGAGGGGRGEGGPHRASRPAATATAAAKAAASRARDNQRANLTGGARFSTSPANVEPIARKTFMLMSLNAGWVGAVREPNSGVCVACPKRPAGSTPIVDRVCGALASPIAPDRSEAVRRTVAW